MWEQTWSVRLCEQVCVLLALGLLNCGGTSELNGSKSDAEGTGGSDAFSGGGSAATGNESSGGSGETGGGDATGGHGGTFGVGAASGVGGTPASGRTTGSGGVLGSGGDVAVGAGPATGVGGGGGTDGIGGVAGTGAVGGTGGGGTGGVEEHGESIFQTAGVAELSNESFFDHPWPSDLRRSSTGGVVLDGYPNPFDNSLIGVYQTLMQGRLDGFSPVATGYVRFTVPLDPATLPSSVTATGSAGSSVKLIDLSEDSPEYGQQKLVMLSFYPKASAYIPENTLAFAPAFGQPLRPGTRYALVVTGAVLDTRGLWLNPAPDLAALLAGDVPAGAEVYADAIDALQAMNLDDIVQLAVFTTTDPTREAFAMRDTTVEHFESPTASSWSAAEWVTGVYDVYEGQYGPSPDFQFGTPPFDTPAKGGDVRYDEQGLPIVQREFELRFALGVPDADACPEPAEGYPIVLVAHGTGGDYRSAFGSNAEASIFAAQCLATLSIDQLFHGERPGAELDAAELLYFNLQNPLAARANGPQSAIDFVQLARLVIEGNLRVPASTSRTGSAIDFDGDRVLFFGHSQGGLNGPIALAADDQYRGGVFSGAAATIGIALLDKTKPYDFRSLLTALLGLGSSVELDEFHPALSLAQTLADPSDGIHYARSIITEPRPGFAAKSLFMLEGVRANGTGDSYAPPRGIEALAAAVGLPVRLPRIRASEFGAWAGLAELDVPEMGISGNLAGGAASGAVGQYDADEASDGHFVAYQVPAARADVGAFLRSLADDAAGRVPH